MFRFAFLSKNSLKTLVLILSSLIILYISNKVWSASEYTGTGVREILGKDLPLVHPQACVRTNKITPKQVSFIMCAKPNDVISNIIISAGIFGQNDVELLLSLTTDYPDATFLDLGANLGSFSVAAAALKYRVVSVDPFITNHAYSRLSTLLFGSEEYVRYILNTVSNGTEPLYPWYRDPLNQGKQFFPFLSTFLCPWYLESNNS
ncbi:uncharacterized protein LOC111712094, partial [Eurytemora carolleeae]|uniref:uncharacterized protein LOC111712094 n=1 Tax=Eurytemora carolleeae TaxID=1294199 RepID=UPI000C77B089